MSSFHVLVQHSRLLQAMAWPIVTRAATLPGGLSTEPPRDSWWYWTLLQCHFHLLWRGLVTGMRAGKGHPSMGRKGPRRQGGQDLVCTRGFYHNSFTEFSPCPHLLSCFTAILFFPLLSPPAFMPLRASHVLPSGLPPAAVRCPPTPHRAAAVQGWCCDCLVCLTLNFLSGGRQRQQFPLFFWVH